GFAGPLLNKVRDEIAVGFRERQRRQLTARYPPHLLPHHRLRITAQFAAIKEQLDDLLRIRVRDGVNEVADVGHSIELLEDLPSQRLDVRLTRVNLAAGKLP